MSAYQLKDGRWCSQHREGKKFVRKYHGRGLEGEAKAREHDAERKAAKQPRADRDRSKYFQDLVHGYIDARATHTTESTMENFVWKMNGIILPRLGTTRAMSITPKRVDAYHPKTPVSPGTRRSHRL
jgi:hypothetical protein